MPFMRVLVELFDHTLQVLAILRIQSLLILLENQFLHSALQYFRLTLLHLLMCQYTPLPVLSIYALCATDHYKMKKQNG